MVSIVSGLLANYLVTDMSLGPVAPFDAAAVFLAIGGVVIMFSWTENKGDNSENTSVQQGMKQAYEAIKNDKKVFYLGAMQSLFEASMYSFVFLWTPALGPNGEDIPHGMIFATMMVACMVGSSVASRIMSRSDMKVERYMQLVFLASAASLAVPVLVGNMGFMTEGERGGSMTFGGKIQMLAFLVFEAMVGIFWPSMMKMRSQYVPEEVRSTVMNFFRIPPTSLSASSSTTWRCSRCPPCSRCARSSSSSPRSCRRSSRPSPTCSRTSTCLWSKPFRDGSRLENFFVLYQCCSTST